MVYKGYNPLIVLGSAGLISLKDFWSNTRWLFKFPQQTLKVSYMQIAYKIFSAIDKFFPFKITSAHCDIPCGIYDPHNAQMAAHTIIRMVNLIGELPPIVPQMTPEQRMEALNKMQRYVSVKEQHAEILKTEVRILWGDYFKPEHLQKFPELHDLVWKTLKLASKARQEINLTASEELLENANKIAEIFWKTKDLETFRAPAPYPTKRETVYQNLKK